MPLAQDTAGATPAEAEAEAETTSPAGRAQPVPTPPEMEALALLEMPEKAERMLWEGEAEMPAQEAESAVAQVASESPMLLGLPVILAQRADTMWLATIRIAPRIPLYCGAVAEERAVLGAEDGHSRTERVVAEAVVAQVDQVAVS